MVTEKLSELKNTACLLNVERNNFLKTGTTMSITSIEFLQVVIGVWGMNHFIKFINNLQENYELKKNLQGSPL